MKTDIKLEVLFNLNPEAAFDQNPLWVYHNHPYWMINYKYTEGMDISCKQENIEYEQQNE